MIFFIVEGLSFCFLASLIAKLFNVKSVLAYDSLIRLFRSARSSGVIPLVVRDFDALLLCLSEYPNAIGTIFSSI